MKKRIYIYLVIITLIIFVLIFLIINVGNLTNDNTIAVTVHSSNQSESVINESSEVDNEPISIIKPDKSTWEKMREMALSGMNEYDTENLTSIIKKRNEYLEGCLTYNNYGYKLSDPNDVLWNEFTSTGEIQIGWSVDTEIWNNKDSYDMTDDEFYQKYGQPVMEYNEYDGNAFISEMTGLKDTIQNDDLKMDFDHMIELMQSAMKNHTVDDIIEIHKILHDMDYYLLRYGPDLYIGYVSDRSSLNEYYGSLYLYQNNN